MMSGVEWDVQEIMGEKEEDGKKYFLVKWKGAWQDSWEPEENLTCGGLLTIFYEDQRRKQEGLPMLKKSEKLKLLGAGLSAKPSKMDVGFVSSSEESSVEDEMEAARGVTMQQEGKEKFILQAEQDKPRNAIEKEGNGKSEQTGIVAQEISGEDED